VKYIILFGLVGFLLLQDAFACRLCHSPLGQQVRMGIFDPNFIFYIIAVTLPFIILGLVVYLLYF
jgi:hypothetical protein